MLREGVARRGWQAGRATTTATTTTAGEPGSRTLASYSASSTLASAFVNIAGRSVGHLVRDDRGTFLEKHVDTSRHLYRRRRAWALDVEHLQRLAALGAVGVRLIDERNRIWSAPLARFRMRGFDLDHGCGRQRALAIEHWDVTQAGVYQPGLFETVP